MKQFKLQGLLLTATILFSLYTLTSQTAEEIIDGYLEVIGGVEAIQNVEGVITVSYTHLTLPTSG